MARKTILITNDDGIYGPGLKPLIAAMKKIGRVIAVVPDQERSGTGHSITLHKPLRIQELGAQVYIVNGTPVDCVRYGVLSLVKGRKVDLVVSGINAGPNCGYDINYSGTVAGAREGALLNIPAMAVSVAEPVGANFPLAARVTEKLARGMLAMKRFPERIYLNVNIPKKVKGIRITSLGQRIYDEEITVRTDPRGQKYYWLAGKFVSAEHRPGTDLTVIRDGYVSITPLQLDPTAINLFSNFEQWTKSLS